MPALRCAFHFREGVVMKESFLEELSKAQPNPGGGAAAAYGASVAVALLEKIVRLELQRHGEGSKERQVWESRLQQVREVAGDFYGLCEEDVLAYLRLAKVRVSAKEDAELLNAIDESIRCPVGIMEKVHGALLLLSDCGKECKKHLVSDLQVACEFLGAALQGAFHIACANLPLVREALRQEHILENLREVFERAQADYQRVGTELAARLR